MFSKIPDILSLSQLKAINLVKKHNGSPYLQDSELAEAVFRFTITMDNPPPNIEDFNYEKWLFDKTKSNQDANITKEYYKNKEIHANTSMLAYYEDTEMSSMLTALGLDYKTNQKGDDKDEG